MAQAHKFRKGKSLFSTTLSAGISTGTGETITPNSVSGLPTDTEITLTIDRVDSGGTETPSKMERITGIIVGGNLTSYTRGVDGSTEQAHSSGAVVEYIWNADDLNDIVDGILVGHTQTGAHNLATGANIQVNSADPTRALYVPAQGMFAATTSGAASAQLESSTNKVNTKVFDFDKDADEYVHFGLQMPLLWDAGTVTAQFIWTTAGTTGDVIWGMQGVALANDDALDTAYGTAQTATDTFLLASDVHISSATSAITIAGSPTAGEWVQFRIYRDADAGGDTLDADARLIGVRIAWKMTKYNDV